MQGSKVTKPILSNSAKPYCMSTKTRAVWVVIFRQGSITWGVILKTSWIKVGQSSYKQELKMNVTALNGKHQS